MIKHPCISICVGDKFCVGCGRTDTEKCEWPGYTETEKKAVEIKRKERLGELKDKVE